MFFIVTHTEIKKYIGASKAIAAKTAYAKNTKTQQPKFYITHVNANQLLSTFTVY